MTERSNRNLYTKISQLVLAGYWIALFVATHLPPTTPFLPGPAIDKLVHALVYAVLAGLLATAWELAAGVLALRHLCWAWVVVAMYGALDEITQIPVGRECSFWDWSADAIGAVVGLALFVGIRRLMAAT